MLELSKEVAFLSLKKGNRRVIIMHLTTPSLEIQVTGEYTVKTVKSTREILKDAVSSFPTKSSAKPPLPHSAPSPPHSCPKAGGWCPCPAVAPSPVLQPGASGTHLPTLALPSQGWCEAGGAPHCHWTQGSPAAGSKKHRGLSQSLLEEG